jgi:hypothetical protein
MVIALVDPSVYDNDVNNPTDGEKLRTDLNNIITEVNAQETDISNILTAALTLAGQKTFSSKAIFEKGLTLAPDSSLTIATGSITSTGSMHKVDTEAAAATDDLDTIVASTTGTLLLITPVNASRNIVIRNNGGGSGNIRTGSGSSITLSSTRHYAILYYHAADTLWYVVATNVSSAIAPLRFKSGKHPSYTSASTVTIPSGYSIMDSTGTTLLTFSADQAVVLSASGANGLDTGAEASSTWYYLYAISDGTNIRGLWSVTNEAVSGSVTLPSGYTLKAQTPYVWRNDGSSNIIPGRYVGANNAPTFWYNVAFRGEGQTGTAGTTEILTNGSATTFTAVSAASFIPPASQFGWFYNSTAGSQNGVGIRATGESHNGIEMSGTNSGAGPVTPCATNSSQSIDYRRVDSGAANAWIAVAGFEVTEIP